MGVSDGCGSFHNSRPIISKRANWVYIRHSDFNCHLDFDVWNFLGQLREPGGDV